MTTPPLNLNMTVDITRTQIETILKDALKAQMHNYEVASLKWNLPMDQRGDVNLSGVTLTLQQDNY